jgi:hypothetical protein
MSCEIGAAGLSKRMHDRFWATQQPALGRNRSVVTGRNRPRAVFAKILIDYFLLFYAKCLECSENGKRQRPRPKTLSAWFSSLRL